jgi:hypothetical protein
VTPPSWKSVSKGPALEVTDGLLDWVTALKGTKLTDQTVLQVFLFCHVLPLKARPTLMWEYIRSGDQSMMADGHLSEESMTKVAWMVLGSVSGELTVDDGPPRSWCSS